MSNLTPGMSETQNAVDFINTEVLGQDVNPKVGSSATMIDQSVGMMVQDLQVFLKGFEQISLVALTKLANNFLTYGTYYNPANLVPKPQDSSRHVKSTSEAPEANTQFVATPNETDGKEVLHSLFKMVTEYGEAKSKISALMHNPDVSKPLDEIYSKTPFKPTSTAPNTKPETTTAQNTETSQYEDVETPKPDDKPEQKQTNTKEKTYWFSRKK